MSRHLIDVSEPHPSPVEDASTSSDVGVALAQCALTWHQQRDESSALEAITADTPRLLDGADAAAVFTVSASGTPRIRAAAGSIDRLRAALSRRPAPNLQTAHPTAHPAPADGRRSAPATLDHHAEMGGMISVPLSMSQMTFGTLLVLGFTADAFTPRSATDATILGIHASLALAALRKRDQWQEAVESRDVIGQAKGILMHQKQLTAPQAFGRLLQQSQRTNVRIRDLAETLCRTGQMLDASAAVHITAR